MYICEIVEEKCSLLKILTIKNQNIYKNKKFNNTVRINKTGEMAQ